MTQGIYEWIVEHIKKIAIIWTLLSLCIAAFYVAGGLTYSYGYDYMGREMVNCSLETCTLHFSVASMIITFLYIWIFYNSPVLIGCSIKTLFFNKTPVHKKVLCLSFIMIIAIILFLGKWVVISYAPLIATFICLSAIAIFLAIKPIKNNNKIVYSLSILSKSLSTVFLALITLALLALMYYSIPYGLKYLRNYIISYDSATQDAFFMACGERVASTYKPQGMVTQYDEKLDIYVCKPNDSLCPKNEAGQYTKTVIMQMSDGRAAVTSCTMNIKNPSIYYTAKNVTVD